MAAAKGTSVAKAKPKGGAPACAMSGRQYLKNTPIRIARTIKNKVLARIIP